MYEILQQMICYVIRLYIIDTVVEGFRIVRWSLP